MKGVIFKIWDIEDPDDSRSYVLSLDNTMNEFYDDLEYELGLDEKSTGVFMFPKNGKKVNKADIAQNLNYWTTYSEVIPKGDKTADKLTVKEILANNFTHFIFATVDDMPFMFEIKLVQKIDGLEKDINYPNCIDSIYNDDEDDDDDADLKRVKQTNNAIIEDDSDDDMDDLDDDYLDDEDDQDFDKVAPKNKKNTKLEIDVNDLAAETFLANMASNLSDDLLHSAEEIMTDLSNYMLFNLMDELQATMINVIKKKLPILAEPGFSKEEIKKHLKAMILKDLEKSINDYVNENIDLILPKENKMKVISTQKKKK